MDILGEWAPLLALAFNALLAWTLWSVKRGLVTREEHHELVRRMDSTEIRIDNLPSRGEWTALRVDITSLREGVAGLHREQKGQNDGIRRIENFLVREKNDTKLC